MKIQTNMVALNLADQMKINEKQKASSTEKLGSGYKINRAGDDAAGLQISEKMRRMIRGLGQASENIQDSNSYLQTGEGAMDEIHAMLQRMKELSIKSMNGTNTDHDRSAMQSEMDALQSEIDKIFKGTEFNTLNIFEEHEDTFYSVEGNVFFRQDQKHMIPSSPPGNTLSIGIQPDVYDLTVPEGIYTTQELMDEMDDIIREKYPDSGLFVTYTDTGYVNVNYENGKKIDSIGGGLGYLIYGAEPQKTEGMLIGVSNFGKGAKLDIIAGKNDVLTFYLGNQNTPTSIQVPVGSYNRDEMINMLNKQLSGTGVEAQRYGDGYISLYCPNQVITGLAGNMIQCDGITSILYDISTYGTTTNKAGYIISGVPMEETVNSQRAAGVEIKSGVNDILKFQLDGKTGTTYCIDLLKGKVSTDNGATWAVYGSAAEYTGDYRFKTVADLANRINDICDPADANGDSKSIGIKASVYCDYANIISYYGNSNVTSNFLKLESTSLSDTSKVAIVQEDARSKAAYASLFTDISYGSKAKYYAGSNERIYGNANISASTLSPVTIDDSNNTMTISQTWKTAGGTVRTEQFTLKLTNGNYSSMQALCDEINAQIDKTNPPANPLDKQNYLRLECSYASDTNGYRLQLTAQDSNVTEISFPNINSEKGTHQLWRGEYPNIANPNASGSGNEGNVGSYKPAAYTGPNALPEKITVDFTNNRFEFSLDDCYLNMDLKSGTYTRQEFIKMLNDYQPTYYGSKKLEFKLTSDNKLEISTIKSGSSAKIHTIYGTALEFITGENLNATPVSGSGDQNYLEGQKIGQLPITIDSTNNSFTFYENTPSKSEPGKVVTKKYTVTVSNGTYADQTALAAAFNNALKTAKVDGTAVTEDLTDANRANGTYTASANGIKGISIYAPTGTSITDDLGKVYIPFDVRTDAGGFYDKILCQSVTDKVTDNYPGYPGTGNIGGSVKWSDKGYFNTNPAYIVGRMDIKGEEVTIKKGVNDKLVLNFTIREGGTDTAYSLDVTLDAGTYNNKNLIKEMQTKLNQDLLKKGLIKSLPVDNPATPEDESIKDSLIRVGIDVVNTEGVPPNIGDGALSNEKQLYFYMNGNSSVVNKDKLTTGTYILDAVRGSAAYSLFYKTEGVPSAAYVIGAADLTEPVKITSENKEFKMNVDGITVTIQLNEGEYSQADLIQMFNDKLADRTIPVKASIQDGHLKLEHTDLNSTHTIDHIAGSAKTLFYKEEGRDDNLVLGFQIGANKGDVAEFKKSNLSTTLLGINSICISKMKYAKKAVGRLDKAIDMVSRERVRFGVTTNRLDHTDSGNEITRENLAASELRIRDTDFAKEAVKNSKEAILMQAQQSLATQAQNINQGVLTLLEM